MSDTFVFRLLLVIIAIVILFALVAQYTRNKATTSSSSNSRPPAAARAPEAAHRHPSASDHSKEGFEQPLSLSPVGAHENPTSNHQPPSRVDVAPPPMPAPFESLDTEMYRAMDYKPDDNSKPQPDPFPRDRLTKVDLLPKDAANTKWAQVNPAGQGDLENVNLLDAGWNFGIDTQGQTLKNPNLQLRSEFANPRVDCGPWNRSTIENDASRRYFEIGQP